MMRLYLARHGQTEMNKKKLYYGTLDVSIDESGVKQCLQLSQKLAAVSFDHVITSSLKRSVESARIILKESNVKTTVYNELSEIDFGLWEGLHYTEVQNRYPKEWMLWSEDWMNFQVPDGESFRMFYSRVKACFEQILQQNKDETVLIVAHAGTLKIIATLLLGLRPEDYWCFSFENGSFSMFEVHDKLAVVRYINC